MKIDNVTKCKILFESFEALKDNFKQNSEELYTVIKKMAQMDLSAALEMWRYLLRVHEEEVTYGNEICSVPWMLLSDIEGTENVYDIILNDPFLIQKLFGEAFDISYHQEDMIGYYIWESKFDVANRLLTTIASNKHKEKGLFDILQYIIPRSSRKKETTQEIFDFVSKWINLLNSSQARAKLNLLLLKLVDE